MAASIRSIPPRRRTYGAWWHAPPMCSCGYSPAGARRPPSQACCWSGWVPLAAFAIFGQGAARLAGIAGVGGHLPAILYAPTLRRFGVSLAWAPLLPARRRRSTWAATLGSAWNHYARGVESFGNSGRITLERRLRRPNLGRELVGQGSHARRISRSDRRSSGARLRPHVHAFYDFARNADDIADSPAARPPTTRSDRLDVMENVLLGRTDEPARPLHARSCVPAWPTRWSRPRATASSCCAPSGRTRLKTRYARLERAVGLLPLLRHAGRPPRAGPAR